MTTFILKGIDKTSGKERILKIPALDQRTAETLASKQGLTVEAVRVEKSFQAPGTAVRPLADGEQPDQPDTVDVNLPQQTAAQQQMVEYLREIRDSAKLTEKYAKEIKYHVWSLAFMLTVFFLFGFLGLLFVHH